MHRCSARSVVWSALFYLVDCRLRINDLLIPKHLDKLNVSGEKFELVCGGIGWVAGNVW